MTNFIEVHYYEDAPMLINVDNIVSINPYKMSHNKENGLSVWGTAITCSNQAADDYYVTTETYDQVMEKIKRCTSTMVIT